MNKKNRKNAIMAGSLAGVLALTGAFAYLTDNDSKTNTFTVGDVKLQLIEDTWYDEDGNVKNDTNDNGIPDFAENVVPTQIITKDPQIKNTGKNDSFVYLEVEVPKAALYTVDADGNSLNGKTFNADGTVADQGAPVYQDIFTYDINEYDPENGVTEGWVLIGEVDSGESDTTHTGTVKRLYCYMNDGTGNKLAPDALTGTLFDSVTVVNLDDNRSANPDGSMDAWGDQVQFNADALQQQIQINAYAIQANFGDGTETKTPAEAWELYATQNQVADEFTTTAP